MTGKVPHAKYECVKYNWQSTGGQKTLRSKNQLAKTNLVKYDRQMDARQSTSWAIQLAGKLRSTTEPEVVNERNPSLLIVMSIGKVGIVGVFAIIYLQTAELFPTIVRSTAFGSCSIISRIGSMLAPVIARELEPDVVIAIFATLSLVAGILTTVLPETKGKKLPDTMEEGEDLGLGQFKCISRRTQHYSMNFRPKNRY